MDIKLRNKEVWDEAVANNTDPYGKAAVDFARSWALIMQAKIEKGLKLKDIAEEASNKADTDGITGFMYGCAVSLLAKSWEYGEELRKWHNAEYGQPESKGTVNPALLTITPNNNG